MPSRSRSRSRYRSRSPGRHHHRRHRDRTEHTRHDGSERSTRHRHSHSRHDRHHRPSHRDKPQQTTTEPKPIVLPFQSRELTKRDLDTFAPMFAMYLDIQKGIYLEDLSEDEVKGRWKSFIRKWNRGELAEGWYDPSTLEKAQGSMPTTTTATGTSGAATGGAGTDGPRRASPDYDYGQRNEKEGRGHDEEQEEDDDDDDDEEYGPILPRGDDRMGPASGPTIPTMQDIRLRNETAIEDAIAARQDSRDQHRAEVWSHRSEIRHMEDEAAPRAEPGTHERRMEKRQEAAAANRSFAESRRGGSPTEAAPEDELMGSGENDLEAIKSAKEREQRKKNEREIRREEMLRARAAEREERLQRYRAKEEETIGWLKNLAKQRFG